MEEKRSNTGRSAAAGSRPKKKLTPEQRRKRKLRRLRRKLQRYGIMAIAVIALLWIAVHLLNKTTLTLSIPEDDQITLQYGDPAPDEVTATLKGSLLNRAGKAVEVKVEGDTDYSTLGTHVATYTAKSGTKKATATRTVEVVDTAAPVITLNTKEGYYPYKKYGYVEEGYTATDNFDGDLTDKVEVSEETDDGVITYTVTDSAGNTATATREIQYASKIVYLTYDDGPGQYTDELLDTLAKYDVKVTFFVTNQFKKYIDVIKREGEEGHTVAIHSYTHDFETIYASVDAFFEDIQKMSDVCVEQTGVAPTIFRFPGGSGNSVSRKYCEGVMTDIIGQVADRGYQYVDWNVNSEDAEGVTDPDQIAENIIAGIQKHDISYVLQHDIKQGSVKAVEQVIKWGQENGYTFLPLTENSYMYHGSTIRN